MSACGMSPRDLQSWIDGEAGEQTEEIGLHVADCEHCSSQAESHKRTGEFLRDAIDLAVGEVEPLVGLQEIRRRIDEHREQSFLGRFSSWWNELWALNRRAMAGVAVAALVGALSAPLLVRWMQAAGDAHIPNAAVEVERLEFAGDARAVVYRPDDGSTAIIWIEPAQEF